MARKPPVATTNPPARPLSFAPGADPSQVNWAGIPAGSQAEASLRAAGYTRPGSSPGGTPASSTTPLPPVSLTAGAQVNAANATLGNTLTGLQGQSDEAVQNYGYNADGTPNNTNPYSRAALLRKGFETAQRRNQNGASNIYGGHYQNLQNISTNSYLQGSDALQRQFQATMSQIAQRRLVAQTAAGNAVSIAKANAADQGFTS